MKPEPKRIRVPAVVPLLILLVIPGLYIATMARTLVLGDPTEYTLAAAVLGIPHPPGYAFITLAGKLFQLLIPVGSIPWRMHLLSVFSATVAALAVYSTVRAVGSRAGVHSRGMAAALFAAFTVATAVDIWQHAIHANPHIITATFLMVNLFLLTRWWVATEQEGTDSTAADRWLLAFSLSAGLGVTHHPLTVFSFPAYALFILVVRPRILLDWRTLLKMVALALLGLSVWLYYPIRSAMEPVFGPHDMNTLSGFLDHVLARGLSESLPFYALADQPARALVFWSLLRLQYTLPVILLSGLGFVWLWRRRTGGRLWPLGLLYGLAFLGNYAFVISLRAQDIMAYLIGPFMIVGLLAAVGLLGILVSLASWRKPEHATLVFIVLFLLGPALQAARNLPQISLRYYDEGQAYVEQVFDYFQGNGQGVVLLHDWEHMTPLWYYKYVEGQWPDPADVRPEFVSTDRPWLESVFAYLPGGPVYLNSYRREIVDAGFRLRPRGPFYQVIEPDKPEARTLPPELTSVPAGEQANAPARVAGYQVPQRTVQAGAYVPLTLAFTAPLTPTDYYVPVLQVGDLNYQFTTDSHLVSPLWRAGEMVVERFDFALPHDLPAGEYPLSVSIMNLSENRQLAGEVMLGTLTVEGQSGVPETGELLANFRQRVGLAAATVWNGRRWRQAPWHEDRPLAATPGDTLNIVLAWDTLAKAEESYTVFVHLIDGNNQPRVWLDYTPLGGAAPTHLWIPKWLPGQRYLDPYRLPIPEGLAPGLYYIEVGLYEMTGGRRLHISDEAGNLNGDRYILGPIVIGE